MYSFPCVHACCLPALLEFAQARPTMSCITLVIIMVVVYRTSCSMRMREVYVASSKVSRGKHKGNHCASESAQHREMRSVR